MRRIMLYLWVMAFLLTHFSLAIADLSSMEDSKAYKQYVIRKSDTELSKLIYLMDRFRDAEFEIKYSRSWYGADEAMMEARKFLQKNYKKESAEKFIKMHTYRPYGKSDILYIKFPNSEIHILRDVLLKELELLNSVTK